VASASDVLLAHPGPEILAEDAEARPSPTCISREDIREDGRRMRGINWRAAILCICAALLLRRDSHAQQARSGSHGAELFAPELVMHIRKPLG